MSSSSAAADATFPMPGTHPGAHSPIDDGDTGLPVADPPPVIEPVVQFPGARPPRRTFLAPVANPAAPAAPPVAPFDIPEVIEPVAGQPEPPPAPVPPPHVRLRLPDWPAVNVWPALSSAAAGFRRLRLPRWPAAHVWPALSRRAAMLRAMFPVRPRVRAAAIAGIGIALVLVVALADLLKIGPFSEVRRYPASAAPSDPALRFGYFQTGAKAGDAEAQLQLGILFAKGEGVAQDYATAATWFRAAAQQGVARAQYDLGVLYERGRGVPVDLTEAASWYLKAAQRGHPLGQYNLAVCYTKGQGIRKDPAEAALWYRRAGSQGVVQAMINLGTMYERGEGVAASPFDAYAWYLAAGRRGNQAAQRRAADLFAGLPRLDQIRAEALASDVAASIRDPDPGQVGIGMANSVAADAARR